MEAVETKRLYEAMFLVDSAQAASDWDGTMGAIRTVLERAGAEIVLFKKWAEKKLAYNINHKDRGTYILIYFKADGARISGMEKDVRLSEKIMRVLILNAAERPQDCIDRDILHQQEESPEPAEGDKISDQEDTEEAASDFDEAEDVSETDFDDDTDTADPTDWSEKPTES